MVTEIVTTQANINTVNNLHSNDFSQSGSSSRRVPLSNSSKFWSVVFVFISFYLSTALSEVLSCYLQYP